MRQIKTHHNGADVEITVRGDTVIAVVDGMHRYRAERIPHGLAWEADPPVALARLVMSFLGREFPFPAT